MTDSEKRQAERKKKTQEAADKVIQIKSAYKEIKDSKALEDILNFCKTSDKYLTACAKERIGYDKEGNGTQLNNEDAMAYLQRAAAFGEVVKHIETRLAQNEPITK